jgi:hypothetical protein
MYVRTSTSRLRHSTISMINLAQTRSKIQNFVTETWVESAGLPVVASADSSLPSGIPEGTEA